MRGGLDDALARMARREELRRRVSDAQVSPAAALEEVVQAARRAIMRDPELSVTVTVAYRGRTSAVSVEYRDGEVAVTVPGEQPQSRQSSQSSQSPPPPQPPQPANAQPMPPSAPAPAMSPLAPSPLPTVPPTAASQLAELLRRNDAD